MGKENRKWTMKGGKGLTGNILRWYESHSFLLYFLGLVLACVAEYLHHAGSYAADRFEEFETGFKI